MKKVIALVMVTVVLMGMVCGARADMACDAVDIRENLGGGYTVLTVKDDYFTANAMAEDGELLCSIMMTDGGVWTVYMCDRLGDGLAEEWFDECLFFLITFENELNR